MAKWIIIGVALLVLWYVLAPLFTPKSLRPRKPGAGAGGKRAKPDAKDVIDGQGRTIE